MSKLHDLCAKLLEHTRLAQDCLIGEGLWDYGDDEGLLDEVQAALKEADGAWQPIETAPMRTRVIVFVPPLPHDDDPGEVVIAEHSCRGWLDDERCDLYMPPTHWRPLPEPPTSPTPDTTGKDR